MFAHGDFPSLLFSQWGSQCPAGECSVLELILPVWPSGLVSDRASSSLMFPVRRAVPPGTQRASGHPGPQVRPCWRDALEALELEERALFVQAFTLQSSS